MDLIADLPLAVGLGRWCCVASPGSMRRNMALVINKFNVIQKEHIQQVDSSVSSCSYSYALLLQRFLFVKTPILPTMTSSIIQLECQCNNYPWGKKGKESLAARYAAATPGGHFTLDESKEYAEVGIFTLIDALCLRSPRTCSSFSQTSKCQPSCCYSRSITSYIIP